nr:hypothetical protein [Tanacetum cinerariifolium]
MMVVVMVWVAVFGVPLRPKTSGGTANNVGIKRLLSAVEVTAAGYGLQSVEERLVHYKKSKAILTDKINVLNLEVKLRDKVLAEYTKNLEKAKKEKDELKLTLEKLQNSSKSLNNLLDRKVSDKSKARLGYIEITPDSFVNSFEILEKQDNISDKGYHVVPPPLTGNYMPSKRDLRLIDKHFESVSVDGISNIAPSDVKTVKTINVNHKGVFSTNEPKLVMNNKFSPPIIEDWHSDDESEDRLKLKELMKLSTKLSDIVLDLKKIKTAQANEIADLKKRVKKLERKKRSRTPRMNLFKIGTSRRRSLGKDDASKHGRNLKQGSIFEESIFDVQAMIDADYELAERLRAEEQRRKPLTKA